jgi:multidrug resistance efflux pump
MKNRLLPAALLLFVVGLAAARYLPGALPTSSDSDGAGSIAPTPSGASEERWVQGTGYVQPASELRRLVFKIDGVIGQCRAEVGSRVRAGDVLMVLDNREQEAAVALAESDLAVARAERAKVLSGSHPDEIAAAESRLAMLKEQVRHLGKELERSRRIFAGSAASEQDHEQARTNLAQKQFALGEADAALGRLRRLVRPEDRELAEAHVRQAEARLRLAEQRLRDTFLRAPCDGTVLEIFKRPGDGQRLIDPEPVLLFADLDHLRVRAEIDERYARRVRVGQEAVLFGRGLVEESFPGRIAAIKRVMGKKTVFSRAAAERRDLEVLEVLIDAGAGFTAPAGLPLDVKIRVHD